MPGMNDIDLVNATVTYNGVTFGGSSATYKSLPPRFKLGYRIVHDETRRVFKGLQYTLSVQNIFYEDTQILQAANQLLLAELLSAQGKSLHIRGLGLGLDVIVDIAGGPHPLGKPEIRMLAENAAEMLWAIEFTVHPCMNTGTAPTALVAFNYTTRWSNDFEGTTTRGISGHYEIIHVRNPANPKAALTRAESVRPNITVALPDGFRRLQNDWHESDDHKRMEFNVTDQQVAGDPYPEGIIAADADVTYATNPANWAKAIKTFSASLRVAPGKARSTAGAWFMQAAMTMQNDIAAALPVGSSVIPKSLVIRAGKFDDARTFNGSISWEITGCASTWLLSGKIFEPVGPKDGAGNRTTFDQWKASISNLWSNRGNANVIANKDDDVIIDLCNNTNEVTIGRDSATNPVLLAAGSLSMTCPEVPEDGGWIQHDLTIAVHRVDYQTEHHRAVPYSPGEASMIASDGYVPLPVPTYETSAETEHVVEYNGLPSTLVLLRFAGLRYRRLPAMPQIITVAGKPATFVKGFQQGPKVKGDLMGCPVYEISGWTLYRVQGLVATLRKTGSKVSCADPSVPTSV